MYYTNIQTTEYSGSIHQQIQKRIDELQESINSAQ